MANLSTLFGAGVKAVYSGQTTLHFGSGAYQTTIPFTSGSVSSKCVLTFTARWDSVLPLPEVDAFAPPGMTGAISGTNIVFSVNRALASVSPYIIESSWQVVEFN